MPGKHAPETPTSFYVSVARSVGGVAAAGIVVFLIIVVAIGRGEDDADFATRPSGRTSTIRATPTATATAPSATATATARPSDAALPRSEITIDVYNGNGRTGLARRVRDRLDDAGYDADTIGTVANTARTTVYFRGNEQDARAFVKAHPEFKRVARARASTPGKAILTIVLGADYTRNN